METLTHVINMEKQDDLYNLLPLGDIHLGNPACDEKTFLRKVNLIQSEPNYLTIGMGDFAENNSVVSRGQFNKHFSIEALDKECPLLSQQVRKFRRIWKPIAEKTIGFHIGNHEDRTLDYDMFKLLYCEPMKIRYLGNMAYVNLRFKHKEKIVRDYLVLSYHSRYSGTRKGGVMNRGENMLLNYDADLILFGHTHLTFTDKVFRLGYTPEQGLYKRRILVANTGSFVQSHVEGYDAYTDKNPGSLRDVGTITVTFDPYNGKHYAHE